MPRNIEGRNPVQEALRSTTKLIQIYVERGVKSDPRIIQIMEGATKKKIEIIILEDISKFAKTRRPQGVIAIADEDEKIKLKDIIEESFTKAEKPLFIVLAGVMYEHNLGTIMRSAEAAGVNAVVISQKSFGLTPVVTKSSAGASEHVKLVQDNLFNAVKMIRDAGVKIVALKEGKSSLYDTKLDCPLCIIVGSEDSGVSTSFEKFIDEYIGIPMKGKISSLNMAVAASVALFEANRQRTMPQADNRRR